MTTEQIYNEIRSSERQLSALSDGIASNDGVSGDYSFQYLLGKITSLVYTAKHIEGQLKFKAKEENKAYKAR